VGKALPRPEGGRHVFDYVPREQFKPYHERRQRHAVQICHRRAGKTVACINELLMRAIAHSPTKPPGRFGFVSPTYTQSKDVAWEYLKSYARPFVSELPNESELESTFGTDRGSGCMAPTTPIPYADWVSTAS
jgi:hypothetical protein